jgi:hypothetical protein
MTIKIKNLFNYKDYLMKRIIFSLSIIFCTYSLHINADQLANELNNLALTLQALEKVITGQPTIPLAKPLIPLQPMTTPTQPVTPLIPVVSGPTMEQQIQVYLNDLTSNLYYLNNSVKLNPQIPLLDENLKIWQNLTEILQNDINFLQKNSFNNPETQTRLIDIKDSTVAFLVSLKALALTKDQATTLLQYIDEFYTNGVAQPDYQTLLGDMSTSNATIEQLKNDLNVIIQTQTNLDDLDTIQMMLNNFKTVQQPRIIPLSATDLDTWRTELTALKNDIQFFKANAPDNVDAQTKIIAIKDSIVDFLVYLKTLALTENQATTLLQYIDEFYTNGVAQPDYQTLLGDMSASNVTIEQLKNDLNAIINPATPLVPAPTPTEPLTPLVPMPEETQPLTPLIPTPEQTQPLTPLVPAPEKTQPLTPLIPVPEQTQPLIPTTPVVPESFKPYIEKLLSNIQLDQPRIDALFTSGDTDTINSFMTKTVADLRNYTQSFNDYSLKINTYFKYLSDEQKQIVLNFLNSIQTGLGTDGMKTLPNLQKAQSDVNTLLQKINP